MTIPYKQLSIVAIDPTSRGVAYVFFENGEILDFGTLSADAEEESQLAIVDHILERCAADMLILEDPDGPTSRRWPRVIALLRSIVKHVRHQGIAVLPVAREDAQQPWRERGYGTKEEVAAAVAKRLPLLEAHVPPLRRQNGETEKARVNIFDAATLALYVFDTAGDDVAP